MLQLKHRLPIQSAGRTSGNPCQGENGGGSRVIYVTEIRRPASTSGCASLGRNGYAEA
ncbi:hypothetical protein K438DRAFT_739545 [Mycena galopus ATCC 62051]|nr:hypothetical protein K438DRAFT_739545 [Mycena galopus ATCC 62051]